MTDQIEATEANRIVEKILTGLIAAGMTDEDEMAEVASGLLRQHSPEVLAALGRLAIEGEIRSVASEMGVTLD